jgi:hypothetical protein
MTATNARQFNYLEYLIIGFVFVVLFALPVLFTRVNGQISWIHVFKIWQDQFLLLPLFAINHWILVPKTLMKQRYVIYFLLSLTLIICFTSIYYYYDEVINGRPVAVSSIADNRPNPIPPYAHLLMYSLLIVGVDTGISISRRWHDNEKKRHLLERQNAEMELEVLRNQISPHFFMNTLNNIYALIDINSAGAKEAVMKLSKLMRYMLYENETGKVKLSKEFEFIQSYIDLMKLRFADEMKVRLTIPEQYEDISLPPMLFISYIENAFKYGASYENDSYIHIDFRMEDDQLHFICINTNHKPSSVHQPGGLGMKNSENRLKLLFGNSYRLNVVVTERLFNVSLSIPVV